MIRYLTIESNFIFYYDINIFKKESITFDPAFIESIRPLNIQLNQIY